MQLLLDGFTGETWTGYDHLVPNHFFPVCLYPAYSSTEIPDL